MSSKEIVEDAWDDNIPSEFTGVPGANPSNKQSDKQGIELAKSDEKREKKIASKPSDYNEKISYLEQLLDGKSEVHASKVLNLMLQNEIQPDDPIFLILLAMDQLETLMVNTPYHIEDVITNFGEDMGQLIQQYFGASESETKERFQAALQEEKSEIAAAARELIVSTKKEQQQANVLTLAKMTIPAFASIIMAIALGVIGTLQYHRLTTKALLVSAGKMTPEQFESFQWAQSDEGQLARQIMELNKGYVGETCKKDAEALGIKLQVGGRKVKSGFCTLFIDPPENRQYES